MSLSIQVKAQPATEAQAQKGMFASVKIELIDETGNVIFSLEDATLRRSKDNRWFIGPPYRQGNDGKFYSYWRVCPMEGGHRDQWNEWLVAEVLGQVGDPLTARREGGGQQANYNPGPPSGPPQGRQPASRPQGPPQGRPQGGPGPSAARPATGGGGPPRSGPRPNHRPAGPPSGAAAGGGDDPFPDLGDGLG